MRVPPVAGKNWRDCYGPTPWRRTARDNLRHALWRVRKMLPSTPKIEYLLADDLSIAFNASADYWLDAAELGKVSENDTPDERMKVLSAFQGELLPGFYDEWVVLEREHLNSIFEHHMARLMSRLQNVKRVLSRMTFGHSLLPVLSA